MLKKISTLQNALQLANDKERTSCEIVEEAIQMAENAREMGAKANERERKFRAASIKSKEIAVRALEQERKCKLALILSWVFFVVVMLFLCIFSIEKLRVRRLSLP